MASKKELSPFRRVHFPPGMLVHLYKWVFSADTIAYCPADRVVVDDKEEPPLLVPSIILVVHYKCMKSLNTKPNPKFQVLILYLSKPMNQSSKFEEPSLKCKIQKWFKLSHEILGIWAGINIQRSSGKGLRGTVMSEHRSGPRLRFLLENKL